MRVRERIVIVSFFACGAAATRAYAAERGRDERHGQQRHEEQGQSPHHAANCALRNAGASNAAHAAQATLPGSVIR